MTSSFNLQRLSAFAISGLLSLPACADWDFQGNAELESRLFFEAPASEEQDRHNGSFAFSPEWHYSFDERADTITLALHGRVDSTDDARTHGDIRELNYLAVFDNYELRIGIGKIFWGRTESQNLVDIINQTDAVDQLDGDEKLGQPMVNLTVLQFPDWGTFDWFVLPSFRERTFASKKGRLRPASFILDTDNTSYEHEDEEHHIDGAFRWSHSIGVFDLGLSQFDGTSREPLFKPITQIVLTPLPTVQVTGYAPHYAQISQTGLDIQASLEGWLLKLETISRAGNIKLNTNTGKFESQRYFASTTGFEYTINEVFSGNISLGLITEWNYDERQENATTNLQNDVLIGTRWAFNDAQSSEILLGMIQDIDYHSISLSLEASTRISNHFKVSLEGIDFSYVNNQDSAVRQVQKDGFIKLALNYYF